MNAKLINLYRKIYLSAPLEFPIYARTWRAEVKRFDQDKFTQWKWAINGEGTSLKAYLDWTGSLCKKKRSELTSAALTWSFLSASMRKTVALSNRWMIRWIIPFIYKKETSADGQCAKFWRRNPHMDSVSKIISIVQYALQKPAPGWVICVHASLGERP